MPDSILSVVLILAVMTPVLVLMGFITWLIESHPERKRRKAREWREWQAAMRERRNRRFTYRQ